MQTDSKTIKKQFEKSMADYDKNAVIQDFTAEKMLSELLKFNNNFETVLELGVGTGLLTKKVANTLNFEKYFGNDLIEKSENYLKKYLPSADFICGNALKIKVPYKMNLVISNAMFQWFDNLEKGLGTISEYIEKDGILAFSTFTPDNYKEIRDITGLTLNYMSKNEIEKVLTRLGFKILYCEEFRRNIKFNNPLEILAHMKKTGVNSLSDKVWDIKKIKSFCDEYSQKYPELSLTYSPIIVIAGK